ncbi:MAG TPA: peptide deformylase, partial [candidate division Zixibacteria bacterium]|nr:peptide deformylase [candidate division Zixibacteria bacterium]
GEEVLREKAKAIENLNGDLVKFLNDMNESMQAAKGLGLAANQVGRTVRAFTIDLSHFDVLAEPKIIINPEIMEKSDLVVTGEEGCLSFPGLYQMIQRPNKITVKALDLDGKEYYYEAEGLVARIMLHEIDHLDGVLFIDKLTAAQRSLIKSKLVRIKAGERV